MKSNLIFHRLGMVVVLAMLSVLIASAEHLCLGDNYYQKKMVKVFEALQEQKLDKAAKYWQEIEEKAKKDDDIDRYTPISQQLFPVWQLSEAMMMGTREGRGKLTGIVPYNPWSAYIELKKACFRPEDRQIADQFLSNKSLHLTVADIKSGIEKALVDTVRQIGTEKAYDQLIDLLFDYADISTIENEREQIAYNSIKRSNRLADSQRYLDKYGQLNQSHHFTIEWRRDSLAFEGLGKTAADCKAYLEAYPSSRFNSTVQELLHRYAFNELKETVAACQEYLSLYPESEYNDSVKSLEKDYAFRDAKASDNIGSYNQYLKDYPDSRHTEQAKQLLQQSVMKRYFNPLVTLDDLHRFYQAADELTGVDLTRVQALYRNLVFMPTSAFMMGCDGLLGRVVFSSNPDVLQDQEVMIFNDQGLMVRHYDARSNINDYYCYGFDPENGFKLVSKTDANGRVVNYTTKWNEVGDILEVAGSDGSIIGYARDYDYLKRVLHFKGRSVVRTDYYDSDFKIDKSVLSGNMTQSYQYNLEGDMTHIIKKRGNTAVVDSTVYDYGYVDGGTSGMQWQWRTTSVNGRAPQTRYRYFDRTIDKTCSGEYDAYVIDWYGRPQRADTASVAALVAELDNSLAMSYRASEKSAPQSSDMGRTVTAERHTQSNGNSAQPAEEAVTPATPATPSRSVDNPVQNLGANAVKVEIPTMKEGLVCELEMVPVEGGTFNMGATAEQDDDAWEIEYPVHQVKVSSFYMCKYEITQDIWKLVMGDNPSSIKGADLPVDNVSWDDCQAFITKLNRLTGQQFRLPTEAEWEYAARGGKKSRQCRFAGSDELDDVAWFSTNSESTSHSVGSKAPNELGLYDMSGNVWEWCADWQNYYPDSFQTDPVGDYVSHGRVQRGGCWNQGYDVCRVSYRGVSEPSRRSSDSGLRLVLSNIKN